MLLLLLGLGAPTTSVMAKVAKKKTTRKKTTRKKKKSVAKKKVSTAKKKSAAPKKKKRRRKKKKPSTATAGTPKKKKRRRKKKPSTTTTSTTATTGVSKKSATQLKAEIKEFITDHKKVESAAKKLASGLKGTVKGGVVRRSGQMKGDGKAQDIAEDQREKIKTLVANLKRLSEGQVRHPRLKELVKKLKLATIDYLNGVPGVLDAAAKAFELVRENKDEQEEYKIPSA